MQVVNPWEKLVTHHPHVRVEYQTLPGNQCGKTNGHTIILDKNLSQAQRRSTLMHELIHLERGIFTCNHKEEHIVDKISAVRLIELDNLVEALLWTGGKVTQEAADELWVDYYTLEKRIENLTSKELEYLVESLKNITFS